MNRFFCAGQVEALRDQQEGLPVAGCQQLKHRNAAALSFRENEDYISSMLYTEARKGHTLAVGSGDGHLSVFDLRAGRLWARSDQQDDELLCMCLLKGGKKLLCGTEGGPVGIFSWGDFGDVSDRLLGHPSSVDAMTPHSDDHVITGSADGFIYLFDARATTLLVRH